MDREQLDGWLEKGILALMLAALVFGPLGMGCVDTWNFIKGIPHSRSWQFLVLETLVLAAALLWCTRWWLRSRPQLLWPPVCWAVLAFAAYTVVRYRQSDVEYVARQEMIRVLLYALVFFIVLNNLHRQEHIQVVGLTLVFLGMAIAVYAGWQFFTKSNRVWTLISPFEGRGSGTFIYPNSLAAFLEMLVPLALGFAVLGRLPHVAKIFIGYAALVMVGGIGVTLSRGGVVVIVAILFGFCVLLLLQRGYRIHGAILLVLLIGAGAFLAPKARMIQMRVQTSLMSGRPDDIRFSLWQAAWRMSRDHTALGVGPAQFDTLFPQYRPAEIQRRPGWVHNDYLNTLVDYGVVGTAIVAAAWLMLFIGILKSWNAVRGPNDDFSRRKSNKFAFMIGASLGLVGILLHSAIDFNLHIPAIAILMVALMALLASQSRFATDRYWVTLDKSAKIVASILLLAGVGYLVFQQTHFVPEWYWLQVRAEETPNFSFARIAALEQAHRAEPRNPETTYAIAYAYQVKGFANESTDPDALSRKAIEWYRLGMKLNPRDGYNWLGCGMCTDRISAWQEPREDTFAFYQRAEELDPNGYYTAANIGWHYFETGDYAAARSWLERSQRLEWATNEIVSNLMPVVERRLAEDAAKNNPTNLPVSR